MKALFLDMDGLMVDTEKLYQAAQNEIFGKYNILIDESILNKIMGQKPIDSCRILVEETGIPLQPEDLLHKRNQIMEQKLHSELKMMPGLMEFLLEFQGIYRMAVVTGASKKFLDSILASLNIRYFFSSFISSDEIKKGKPEPEIYEKAMESLCVSKEHGIALEDSSNGALSAKRAGLYVIAIPNVYTSGQNFSFVDYMAKDLYEAKEHIKNLIL
ncbi:MAG: HAD family phosphatase [Leptospiraceae bacterium]|nr:HAD family phosphatase [Leptospiraceae bacterium]MCP5499263.1 HAD family phosphatase [Leptospiraceae bacterium]